MYKQACIFQCGFVHCTGFSMSYVKFELCTEMLSFAM